MARRSPGGSKAGGRDARSRGSAGPWPPGRREGRNDRGAAADAIDGDPPKVVHTAIFVVLSACVLYVLASGALGRIDHWTWIALVAIRVLGGGQ